ncbi:MAG: hypothetical protein AAGI03_04180 [Pseudomonadota bacterium]
MMNDGWHDLARQNWSYVLAIAAGLLVSFLTADQQSVAVAIIRVVVGFVCALLFTPVALDLLEQDSDAWRHAVAALIAMSAYVVARMVNRLKWSLVIDLLRAWRGER